jgi:hypothetical protein
MNKLDAIANDILSLRDFQSKTEGLLEGLNKRLDSLEARLTAQDTPKTAGESHASEIAAMKSGVFPGRKTREAHFDQVFDRVAHRANNQIARIQCLKLHGYYPDNTCTMDEWIIFPKNQSCVTWGLATCTAIVATNQDNVLMAHYATSEVESIALATDIIKEFQPDTLTVVYPSSDPELRPQPLRLDPELTPQIPFSDFNPIYITYDWEVNTSSNEAYEEDRDSRMVSWHDGQIKEHFLRKKYVGQLAQKASG